MDFPISQNFNRNSYGLEILYIYTSHDSKHFGTKFKSTGQNVPKLWGLKVWIFRPPRAGDLEGTLADTCAAKRTLGFEARKNFEREIREMVRRVTAKESARGELGRRRY